MGLVGLGLGPQIFSSINAAGATLSLYPSSGYAVLNENFAVDIMLDTGGAETTSTQAVFRFDPDKIEVTKAQHGELYCDYPDDDYSVDNVDGWVKLTGFCLDPYYSSGSSEELFGRITFQPLVEGEVELEFVTTGTNEDWYSFVKDTGSPPEDILSSSSDGRYTVVSEVPRDVSAGTTGTTSGTEKLPGVGLLDGGFWHIGAGLLVLAGIVMVGDVVIGNFRRKMELRSERTVVV